MARVTIEDCIDKLPNRFELVLLSAHRARMISQGAPITLDRDNDKDPVVSLRETQRIGVRSGAYSRRGIMQSRLSAAQCESIVQTAVARGLAAPGMRCLTLDQATDGWSLDSAGRLPAVITVGASLPEPAPRRALNASSTALRLPSVRPARRLHA